MKKDDGVIDSLNKLLSRQAVKHEWYSPESETDCRTMFAHDQSVIIYSNAFRRMSSKSQIIVKPLRDHFRSRLVHTFEVSEIAVAIGSRLNLNTTLIEAIALGHDLGHTPFGHAGERAVQGLVVREAAGYLGINIPEAERSRCFSHASNSSRILAFGLERTSDAPSISTETVSGALTHSWNPWKGFARTTTKQSPPPLYGPPRTYEAQVVAIADQLAGINHDIEDILEARSYVGIEVSDLIAGVMANLNRKLKGKTNRARKGSVSETLTLSVTFDEEKGYGRKYRIENSVTQLVEHARAFFQKETPTSDEAARKPLPFPEDLGILLDAQETFIREVLRSETWFIGRDTMSDAMVTTVFNHFWPKVREWSVPTTGEKTYSLAQLPFSRAAEQVRRGDATGSTYLEHFEKFFRKRYVGRKDQPYDLSLEVSATRELGFDTWVAYLYDKLPAPTEKPGEFFEAKQKLTRLVALVDFISGLTDRYCLEIFQATYGDFMVQG